MKWFTLDIESLGLEALKEPITCICCRDYNGEAMGQVITKKSK